MKTIIIGTKTISLDIGDEIRVKDLKKINPIVSTYKAGNEVDMMLALVSALSINAEEDLKTVEEMTIPEFTELSLKMGEILNTEKKTNESSTPTPVKS